METDIKQRVRQFYDRVGWQVAEDGHYQNARYEDLRPVSQEYIHRCHLRVKRYLRPTGRYLLDAGSGPVQYVEYLAYSEGYQYRVCADISFVALQEAKRRLGSHALCVVADVANLPFKAEPFEGIVSLHTLHHLPLQEQGNAYDELYRVLQPGCSAVIVNGWTDSPLMRRSAWLVKLMERLGARLNRNDGGLAPVESTQEKSAGLERAAEAGQEKKNGAEPTGTFIRKQDADWLRQQLGGRMPFEIQVWRSVSVRFLRAVIHASLGGRLWLHLLYRIENTFPRFFGEEGQYPLISIQKPGKQ